MDIGLLASGQLPYITMAKQASRMFRPRAATRDGLADILAMRGTPRAPGKPLAEIAPPPVPPSGGGPANVLAAPAVAQKAVASPQAPPMVIENPPQQSFMPRPEMTYSQPPQGGYGRTDVQVARPQPSPAEFAAQLPSAKYGPSAPPQRQRYNPWSPDRPFVQPAGPTPAPGPPIPEKTGLVNSLRTMPPKERTAKLRTLALAALTSVGAVGAKQYLDRQRRGGQPPEPVEEFYVPSGIQYSVSDYQTYLGQQFGQIGVDGQLGPETTTAISLFQRREGIEETGQLDYATKRELRRKMYAQQQEQ